MGDFSSPTTASSSVRPYWRLFTSTSFSANRCKVLPSQNLIRLRGKYKWDSFWCAQTPIYTVPVFCVPKRQLRQKISPTNVTLVTQNDTTYQSFIKQESDRRLHPHQNPLVVSSNLCPDWPNCERTPLCSMSAMLRGITQVTGATQCYVTGLLIRQQLVPSERKITHRNSFTVFICVHKYPALTVAARSNSWQYRDVGTNLLVPVKCSIPNREQSNKSDPNKIFVKNNHKPLSASSVPNRYGEGFGHGSVVNSGVMGIRHLARNPTTGLP